DERDRNVDAPVYMHHPGGDAAQAAHRLELDDQVQTDARAVRVLLRHAAFPDLRDLRSLRRPRFHRWVRHAGDRPCVLPVGGRGHLQAALHYDRLHSVRADDPPGGDVDGWDDSPARRQEMAVAPPLDLYLWRSGRRALLVACEGRREPTPDLC